VSGIGTYGEQELVQGLKQTVGQVNVGVGTYDEWRWEEGKGGIYSVAEA